MDPLSTAAHQEAGKLLTERLPLWQLAITWFNWTDFCGFKGQTTLITVLFLTQWLNYNLSVRNDSWHHLKDQQLKTHNFYASKLKIIICILLQKKFYFMVNIVVQCKGEDLCHYMMNW